MGASTIRTQLDKFCESLQKVGLILHFNEHTLETNNLIKDVSWRGNKNSATNDYMGNERVTVDEYLVALERNHYSFLLKDGGIVQISVSYENSSFIGYRYAYLPCPISLKDCEFAVDDVNSEAEDDIEDGETEIDVYEDEDLYEESNKADLLKSAIRDISDAKFRKSSLIVAPLRFEWKMNSNSKLEPASHVHLGVSEGRIAISHPISIWNFIEFVIKNFYPADFDKFKRTSGLRRDKIERIRRKKNNKGETIRECEKLYIHFFTPDPW